MIQRVITQICENPRQNQRKSASISGFTLIEMIIYVAIIGGVIASFVSYSLSIGESRNKSYVAQEVHANSRLALDVVTNSIRSANGINVGASTFDADPGILSLSMANLTLNPTIIDLSADDGILRITQGANAPIEITNPNVKVTNLIFENLTSTGGKASIGIDLTIDYANSAGDKGFEYHQDLHTAVTIRN